MIRLINAEAVNRLLPMPACIDLMRHAFRLAAAPETIQPIRQALPQPDGRGLMSMMPGYTDDPRWLGIKVVSVFPGNFGTPYGSHQGMILLFETGHGRPVAVLDGREVTAIRTAAASAAATDALARTDSRTLGLLGYGEQARTHVQAIRQVRRIDRVFVWGRHADRASAFARSVEQECEVEAVPVADARAAAEADIVCTTTAAVDPVLSGDWLVPGQHLNIVGSSIPSTAEVDSAALLRSRVFVDYLPSALELGGDIRRALAEGVMTETHIIGSVGDVLLGNATGRRDDQDITLFKSLGMVAEDLVAADHVLREAENQNIGSLVEW